MAKFTDEQKHEIALELLSGKLLHGEICRKHGLSATYAYKLKRVAWIWNSVACHLVSAATHDGGT